MGTTSFYSERRAYRGFTRTCPACAPHLSLKGLLNTKYQLLNTIPQKPILNNYIPAEALGLEQLARAETLERLRQVLCQRPTCGAFPALFEHLGIALELLLLILFLRGLDYF